MDARGGRTVSRWWPRITSITGTSLPVPAVRKKGPKAPVSAVCGEVPRTTGTVRTVFDWVGDATVATLGDESVQGLRRQVAEIAHDMGNAITGLEVLALDDPSEGTREVLDHCAQLVDRLRRLGSAAPASPPVRVVVDEVLARAVPFLRALLGDAVALEVQVGAPGSRVDLDEVSLQRVVINLVKNAGEALGSRPGRVAVATTVDGRQLTLSVVDDGPGLPPEQGRSGGLGLEIVRRITRGAGGDLLLDRAHADGARVSCVFPVSGS